MERRLAAILLTDMVGYSRLMGLDEEGTISRQKAHRDEVFDPKVSQHGGRIVKSTGDGILVEFPSAVDSVKWAVEVQEDLAGRDADLPEDRRIQYRIGINLGDIVIDGEDILGDGVNVAARLEGLAEPGGICISGTIYDQLAGKLDIDFRDAGEQSVKNVPRPVRVWHWQSESRSVGLPDLQQPLPLPDKPSLAVLPFENLSNDPEQEFFADGIAEDVISALSRFRSLFVIARTSSFSYKNATVDVIQIGRELGVRYVVEGSVRKAGNRVRIAAQLIDARDGTHLWAERFDGSLEDIFDLQDKITEQIVVEVEPEIQALERQRVQRGQPNSINAWENLQRGLSHFYRFNPSDRSEAIRLFKEAISADPSFALAYARLSYTLSSSVLWGYTEDRSEIIASARAAAERAVSLDINEPLARFAMGRAHIFDGDVEIGISEKAAAIKINPNYARGHFGLGWAHYYGAGHPQDAISHFANALRLSPRDPTRWAALLMLGSALKDLGRHEEAIEHCRQSCQFPNAPFGPNLFLASALAEAGQISEAQAATERALQILPSLSISFLPKLNPGAHQDYVRRLTDSLRKAGLPE